MNAFDRITKAIEARYHEREQTFEYRTIRTRQEIDRAEVCSLGHKIQAEVAPDVQQVYGIVFVLHKMLFDRYKQAYGNSWYNTSLQGGDWYKKEVFTNRWEEEISDLFMAERAALPEMVRAHAHRWHVIMGVRIRHSVQLVFQAADYTLVHSSLLKGVLSALKETP